MKRIFLAGFFFMCLFIKNIMAQEIFYGHDKTVTRAEVAKMISFIYGDKKNILEAYKTREITFVDSDINNWFDKYLNFVVKKKIMAGVDKNKFEPEKYLNLSQAQILLDKINPENKIKIKIDEVNKNKFISYSLWVKLFLDLISDLDIKNIKQKEIISLATYKQNKEDILKDFLVSDKNYFCYEGIDFDFYNKKINVLLCGHEIMALLSYDDEFDVKFKILDVKDNRICVKNDLLKIYFLIDTVNLDKNKIKIGESYILKIKCGKIIDITESNNLDNRKKNQNQT